MNRKDILLKLENLKREYETKEKQIGKLEDENDELEKKIIHLKDSLIIKPKQKTKSSGGIDTHYEHTVSLEVNGNIISNTAWDNWRILTFTEKDMQDIYEDRAFYDLKSLKDYCDPKSYKKLCAYFDYRNI